MIRLMIYILELLFALGALALLLGGAWLLLRPLLRAVVAAADRLARLATALLGGAAVAAGGGFLAALIVEALAGPDPRTVGTLAGAILWPLATGGLLFWQDRAATALDRQLAKARRPEPPADDDLARAWDVAGALAHRHGKRLDAARRACARLLHAADATPLDVEAMDCAIIIRRHIPDLVSHTAALCESAGPDETSLLTNDMLASIEKIAADAERLNERERARLRQGLKVVRAHIDSRTAGGSI